MLATEKSVRQRQPTYYLLKLTHPIAAVQHGPWIQDKYCSSSGRNQFDNIKRNVIQAGNQVQRQPIIPSRLLIPLSLTNMDPGQLPTIHTYNNNLC